MLKQQARLIRNISVLIDIFCLAAGFILAYHVAKSMGAKLDDLTDYAWVLLFAIPIWLFLYAYFGIYSSLRTCTLGTLFANLLKVQVIATLATSSMIYMVAPHGVSRRLFGTFIVISYLLQISVKGGIKTILSHFRIRGRNIRHILIVGSGEKSQRFVELIHKHAAWGLVLDGCLALDEASDSIEGCKRLGVLDDIIDVCKGRTIDEVVFSLPHDKLPVVDYYLPDLEQMGVTVRMVLDFHDMRGSRRELSLFHDELPILTIHSKAFDSGQLFLKRCLDIAGAIVGLFITGLLLPFIALAIRLESRGPIFFGQDRVGVNGRIFKCWKFRSMHLDAEERKKELLAQNEMQGAMFKIKDDPRVTRFGSFFRKTSLDELPQFWNVLRGEMSLVGTRPPTPDEVATYENWHRKRICIKPGITGLWQVSGRSQIQDFDEVVRLDIRYIEEWSLWLDIKLLLRTVWVVVAGKGAR